MIEVEWTLSPGTWREDLCALTLTLDEAGEAFQSVAMYVRVVTRESSGSKPSVQVPDDFFRELDAQLGGLLDSRVLQADNPGMAVQQLRVVSPIRSEGRAPVIQGAVAPGAHDLYVAVRERPTAGNTRTNPKSAVLRQELHVPDFSKGLRLSSPVVVDRVEPLAMPVPVEEQAGRPYALGTAELVPAVDLHFDRTEDLSVFFFVYNARLNDRSEPDIGVRYRLLQPLRPPIVLGETVREPFRSGSPAGRGGTERELPVSQALSLGQVSPGKYEFEVEVTDYLTGETVRQALAISVGGLP